MEETCNVELEPVLQAGVPSVDVEGMRRDAPDFGSMDISARKPRVNMSEPQVDMPGGTLKTPISDPNAFSDVDLSGPSTGLDLPSTKKKSGGCFSCASTGDKEEPYSKGRANAGLYLDRPNMKTDRKVKVSGAPPEVSVPSANTGGTLSGPSVNSEDFDFDSSCPDVDTSKRPKAHLDTNTPSIKTPQGNLAAQISQPEVDLSTEKRQALQGKFDALPTERDLPPKKKKSGNCLSCIRDINKDQPYRKSRKNVDLDIGGPGGSMEMSTGGKFDLRGSGPSIQGAEGRIPQKELGLRASAPDRDLDVDKEQNIDTSAPDLFPPSSSAEIKTGKLDFDGSCPTIQGAERRLSQKEFGLRASVPDVDLDVDKERNIDISGPDASLPSSSATAKISRPSFGGDDDFEPNLDFKGRKPKVKIGANGQDFTAPDLRPEIDVSSDKTKDTSVKLGAPSAQMNLPSSKKKRGNCLKCTGTGGKEEPYRKASDVGYTFDEREADGSIEMKKIAGPGFNVHGREGGVSGPESDVLGSGPDFGVQGSHADVSRPDYNIGRPNVRSDLGVRGPNANVSGLDISAPKTSISGPTSSISGPDLDVREPNVGISGGKPKMGLDTNIPSVNAPEGKIDTKVSGPNVDVSTGNIKDSKVTVDMPSAGIHLPSKKAKGGNCLSCTSSPDKDEPYRTSKGNADFAFDGPDVYTEGPDADIEGLKRKSENAFNLSTDTPGTDNLNLEEDAGISFTNASFPSTSGRGEFDVGGSGPDLGIRTKATGVEYDANGPKLKNPKGKLQTEISSPGVDVSTGNVQGPPSDGRLPSRKKARGNCLSCAGDADKDEPYGKSSASTEFKLEKPDIDGSLKIEEGGKFDLDKPSVSINDPDFEGASPVIDLPSDKAKVGFKSPEFDIPSIEGNREVQITRPGLSHGKPKISGPSFDPGDKEFAIGGPDLDIDTALGEGKWGVSKPDIAGPKGKIDLDANRPSGWGEFDVGDSGPDLGIRTKATGLEYDANGPKLKKPKGKLQTEISSPDVDISTGNVQGPSSDGRLPSRKKARGNCLSCAGDADKDEPYGKSSASTEFKLEKPDIDGSLKIEEGGKFDLDKPSVNINDPDFEGASPDIDFPSDKAKVGFKSPEFDIPSIEGNREVPITRPELSHEKPKISGPSFDPGDKEFAIRGPDLDIDTALGEGKWGVSKPDIAGPKGEIDLDANRPNLDSAATEPQFGVKGLHIDSPEPDNHIGDLRFGGSLPKISGPSFDPGDNEFAIRGPDLDIDTALGEGKWGVSKPDIAGPKSKIDLDANRPDLDSAATEPQFGVKGLHIDSPEPDNHTGDLRFGGSLPDLGVSEKKPEIGLDKKANGPERKLDLDFKRPGLDVSKTKPRFEVKGLDTDTSDRDISDGDLGFTGRIPDLGLSGKKPEIELGMDGPDKNVIEPTGKFDFDVNRPGLDDSGTNPQFGIKGLDMNTPEPVIPADNLRFGTSKPDVNWGVKTSTPKVPQPYPELDVETKPLDGNISVANDYNFELQSAPDTFPSLDYEKPRSLQRYDEIRPDMELRLLPPKTTEHPDNRFDFNSSLDMEQSGEQLKPGEMTLVKVEENVTVCSASIEEDDSPSPRNRTLTLDREIKQQIEVVFPEEEGSNEKRKISSSSSSSSPSDADADGEKPSKRKKKSRLLKAFRKSSTSSASSKEDGSTVKKIRTKRRSSTSSSSSDDENKRKKDTKKGSSTDVALPTARTEQKKTAASSSSSSSDEAPDVEIVSSIKRPEPDVSLDAVTTDTPSLRIKTEKPKERKGSTSSSSSDEDTGKENTIQKKEPIERKSSTSSTSSTDKDDSKDIKVSKLTNAADGPVVNMPKTVSHTVKPTDPDLTIGLKKPEDSTEPKHRKTSTSSSSDAEVPTNKMASDDSKPSMLYQVEYFTNQQTYIIEPHEDLDNPVLSVADVPKEEFHSVDPRDPELSFIKPSERKRSTSSSSSSDEEATDKKKEDPVRKRSTSSSSSDDSGRVSPKLDTTLYRYETVHHILTPTYPFVDQANPKIIQEHPVVVVSRSFKNPVSEKISTVAEDQDEPQNVETQFSEPSVDMTHHLEYPYNIPTVRADSDKHAKEKDIVPVVKLKSDFLVELEPDKKPSEDEDSTEHSKTAGKEDRDSPSLNIQAHTFETVYHVNMPENPAVDGDSLEIREHSPIVVSRSRIQNPVSENVSTAADQDEPQNAEVQLSEPPVDITHHLEYPYNIPTVKADSDKHAKEEDIVPVVKLKPDFLVELEPDEKPSDDEDSSEHSKTTGKERDSPTLNIQTHTFETVYHVNMPENPSVDGDSLEIREHSPIVVSRSIKRISLEDVDQEEEPPLFTTNTDVQFSEPSSDFQLEYPEGDNVFTTGEHDLKMTDEKWIVGHSLQKEEPDIPALVASLDRPAEKTQPTSDPSRDEGDKATSPREKSAKDTRRRSSNSRLWELMQGYLIEKPITDDDETKADDTEVEECKEEIAKPEPKKEKIVSRVSLKPAKFETLNAPVQVVDKEPAKEVITSGPKVDDVSKVVPSVLQIDPVAFQVDLGGKKAEVKEHDAELRRQPSLPVDEDDNEDDPWMRHYSKGLQRGQRQPASTKSPEKESGFSFSKVPHVRGIRTSADRERERPKYTIEGLTRIEPRASRSSTGQDQARKNIDEVGRQSVSSLRSFWDK